MKVRIEKGTARGIVSAPPSKSMAHRLLICAGLSDGECIVHGISDSEDMLATMDCLRTLGVQFEKEEDTVRVSGIDISKAAALEKLNCRESGSTLRFFVPIALLTGKETVLAGSRRLMERPLSVYEELFSQRCRDFLFGISSFLSVRPNTATLLIARRSRVFVCKAEIICMGIIHCPSSSSSAARKWLWKSCSSGVSCSNSRFVRFKMASSASSSQ